MGENPIYPIPINKKIEKWFSLSDQSDNQPPSPHYCIDDSDLSSEGQNLFYITSGSSSSCPNLPTPEKLLEKLKYCPICNLHFVSPNDTIKCIKSHKRHLCFFCFKLIDGDSVNITRHCNKMNHFSSKEKFLVKCPFTNCDKTKEYNHLIGIKVHITRVHLTSGENFEDSSSIENMNEQQGSTSSIFNINKSLSSEDSDAFMSSQQQGRSIGAGGNFTSSNHLQPSNSNGIQPFRHKQQIGKHVLIESNGPNAFIRKEIVTKSVVTTKHPKGPLQSKHFCKQQPRTISVSSSSSSSLSEVLITSRSSFKAPKTEVTSRTQKSAKFETLFVCQLCDKIFNYREGILNHNIRRKCDFMNGKTCYHCRCPFDGYSILKCVRHLIAHKPLD